MAPAPDRPDPAVPHRLRGLDVDGLLADPARKQSLVTPVFDLIAPRYDAFTRAFSFGMDAGWKARLLDTAVAVAPRGAQVVDVACGTGDLGLAFARTRPDTTVTCVDVSSAMLAQAAARLRSAALGNACVMGGDLKSLPFRDRSVDLVLAGYAVRNAPSWRFALGEVARVCRPGAHVLMLDFHRPEAALWRALFLGYLGAAGRVVGWLWHREPLAYGYIAPSIEHFVSAHAFACGLDEAGFHVADSRRFLAGGVALHHAVRR